MDHWCTDTILLVICFDIVCAFFHFLAIFPVGVRYRTCRQTSIEKTTKLYGNHFRKVKSQCACYYASILLLLLFGSTVVIFLSLVIELHCSWYALPL